jgi:hypothetical protein
MIMSAAPIVAKFLLGGRSAEIRVTVARIRVQGRVPAPRPDLHPGRTPVTTRLGAGAQASLAVHEFRAIRERAAGAFISPPDPLLARPHRRFRATIIAHGGGPRGLMNRSGLDILFLWMPRDMPPVLRDGFAAEPSCQNHRSGQAHQGISSIHVDHIVFQSNLLT